MVKWFYIILSIIMVSSLVGCAIPSVKNGELPKQTTLESTTEIMTTAENPFSIVWDMTAPVANSEEVLTTSDDSNNRYVIGENGQLYVKNEDEIMVDTSKLNIAGNYNILSSNAMQECAAVSGLESDFVTFFSDEIVLKILAGDSDVDIYLLGSSEIDLLKKRSIYYPLKSDVIDSFVDGCFDYLGESVTDDVGKIIALPLSIHETFLSYPIDAEVELGFALDDIKYYQDFHNLVNSYDGERVSYAIGANLFFNYDRQYENYYCDFDNMIYDFNTDVYRGIYSLLDGWQRYGYSPSMPCFINPAVLGADATRLALDSKKTLFNTNSSYDDFIFVSTPDQFAPDTGFDINDWRVVHIPWISHDFSENYVNATYAFINPYSKHYDEAVRFLEYIAENYFDSINTYTFIRDNKEEYPDSYMKDTQMFSDVYDICKNGFVSEYTIYSSRNDIDEYQNGRITLDEAIAMYQREVEIWLNE